MGDGEGTVDQGNTWLTWCSRHILTNGPGIEALGGNGSGGGEKAPPVAMAMSCPLGRAFGDAVGDTSTAKLTST